MTLYELTNSINIQGNVEIRIMDESDEIKETLFYETEELSCGMDDLKDLEDFVVTYIYPDTFKRLYPNHTGIIGRLIIEIKQK